MNVNPLLISFKIIHQGLYFICSIGIRFDFPGNLVARVQNGRMISSSKGLADLRKRHICHLSCQIHSDLSWVGHFSFSVG